MELAADAQFIGRLKDGKIVAATAFSHWTGHDVELTVAGERGGGSKTYLACVFGYAFDQLGCVRCTVKTRSSNEPAIALARRLGFQQEGVIRNGFGNEDAILFGLLKEECHGKRRRKATSGT
jgi:RimJ/RimL family protein N-acetyltransferase